MRTLFLMFLLLFSGHGVAGKIYRCETEDDRIEFSDRPCGREVEIRDETRFGGRAPLRPVTPVEPLPAPTTYEEWQERKSEHDAARTDFNERIKAIDLQLLDIKSRLIPMIDQGASDEAIEALSAEERDLQAQRRDLTDERNRLLDRLDPGMWVEPQPDGAGQN